MHQNQVWSNSNVEDLLNIQIIQILDITVDNENMNVPVPNSMEFRLGRSIH